MFRYGKGGLKANGYRAIEFYEKLDALDDKRALLEIAETCAEGCGKFKANGQRALEIYEEIIRHGKYWAGVHRDFGIKSPRLHNYEEALEEATLIYLEGKGGVVPDGYKAIEYLSELAKKDTEKLRGIAEIYLEGKAGVEPDGYKAIEYLTAIIERNETDNPFTNPSVALRMLAYTWKEGKGGVTQDGYNAVECFTKLTENDDDDSDVVFFEPKQAFYELGTIYEEGCGEIVPDLQEAIAFYQKSAKLEYWLAKIKLEELTGSRNA